MLVLRTFPVHFVAEAMRTPEEVATDYNGRRAGILKALVDDVEQFYQCCDPERENLCLYGNQDGTWEVALPAEEVPPEMPEPSLGINFARNGMQVRYCSQGRNVCNGKFDQDHWPKP